MSDLHSVLRTVDLPSGSVIPFTPVAGERVRILYGRVWLTEEGSTYDAFLGSGEEMRLAGRGGLAVVEALGPARIQLVQDLPASSRFVRATSAWARRSGGALRRWRLRLPRPARGAV
jgi:hypothetical protein